MTKYANTFFIIERSRQTPVSEKSDILLDTTPAITLPCFFNTVTSLEGKYLYSKVYYAIIQNSYIQDQSQYHKIYTQ